MVSSSKKNNEIARENWAKLLENPQISAWSLANEPALIRIKSYQAFAKKHTCWLNDADQESGLETGSAGGR